MKKNYDHNGLISLSKLRCWGFMNRWYTRMSWKCFRCNDIFFHHTTVSAHANLWLFWRIKNRFSKMLLFTNFVDCKNYIMSCCFLFLHVHVNSNHFCPPSEKNTGVCLFAVLHFIFELKQQQLSNFDARILVQNCTMAQAFWLTTVYYLE